MRRLQSATKRIRPQPSDVRTAEAVVASVRGPIKVGFRNESACFDLYADVPAGATATVSVPVGGCRRLTLNGCVVWDKGQPLPRAVGDRESDDQRATFRVDAGKWQFRARQ